MDTFVGMIIGGLIMMLYFNVITVVDSDEQRVLHEQKIECEQTLPRNQECQYVVVSPDMHQVYLQHEKEEE